MEDPKYTAKVQHRNGNITEINFAMELLPRRSAYMAIESRIPLHNLPHDEADWPAAFAKYLREIADMVEVQNQKQLTSRTSHGKLVTK